MSHAKELAAGGTLHLHNPADDEKADTIHIEQLPNNEEIHRTKTGTVWKTRNGIELVPTPSNDPSDPLNWPLYWKLITLFCVCASSLMLAFTAAGIIPGENTNQQRCTA